MTGVLRNPIGFTLCLLILAVGLLHAANQGLLVQAAISLEESHAVLKHGEAALAVQDCFEKNGTVQLWQRGNNRFLALCEIDRSIFGIRIFDKIPGGMKEKTAFVKDKMHSIRQVEQYLRNSKAEQIWRWGESVEKVPPDLVPYLMP